MPTIVFGYFALTFFTQVVYDDLLGMDVRTFNALSAGIIMGFMVLPTWRARRPKPAKLAVNLELRRYVQDRLSGTVQRPDGVAARWP